MNTVYCMLKVLLTSKVYTLTNVVFYEIPIYTFTILFVNKRARTAYRPPEEKYYTRYIVELLVLPDYLDHLSLHHSYTPI